MEQKYLGVLGIIVVLTVIGILFIIVWKPPVSNPIVIEQLAAGSMLSAECMNTAYLENRADYVVDAKVESIEINTDKKVINLSIINWLKGNKNTSALQIITSAAEQGDSAEFEENKDYRIYLWELDNKLYLVCEFLGVQELGSI